MQQSIKTDGNDCVVVGGDVAREEAVNHALIGRDSSERKGMQKNYNRFVIRPRNNVLPILRKEKVVDTKRMDRYTYEFGQSGADLKQANPA
jgi:hypothetical protein